MVTSLTENSEEVLHFQAHIFRKVCAVYAVEDLVLAELCPHRLRTEMFGDFWVGWSDEVAEVFVLAYNLRKNNLQPV